MRSRAPATSAARPGSTLRATTVALIGQDGAGKSTIARAVCEALPYDAETVYMGVNLEASTVMLPTTRLSLAIKRRRGRRADMTAHGDEGLRRGGVVAGARRLVRTTNWIAEELYRAALVRRIRRRGAIAIQDRDFYCDYYWAAVAPTDTKRPLDVRFHGAFLRRWYPKPDLVLLLDAPAEILFARRPDGGLAEIAARRDRYVGLASVMPTLQVVDADRPVGEVVADITDRIVAFVASGIQRRPITDATAEVSA